MATTNRRISGSTLGYTVFVSLVVMGAFGFLRMASYQHNQEQIGISELRLSYQDLKATNHKLTTKLEQLETEKGNLESKLEQEKESKKEYEDAISNLQSNPPKCDEKDAGQPKVLKDEKDVDVVAKGEVITNYDALVFAQNYFNKHGEILNKDKFTLAPDFIPIVVRVFDKHEYVKYVLEHYRNVKGINETIMVFSHDGIFPEVFKVIESIDFCQVKQVIHPYSGHTLKNRFPGKDLTLPDHRDQYGNPRPFPHTALKHHYWWHLNTVWDVLFPTHTGDIILMEEDHAPTFDFYVTLKGLTKIRDKECPDECFNVQLHEHGIYANMNPHGGTHELVQSGMFGNIGISFNRKMFIKIKNAAKTFCEFDDYNWDWTTIHLQTAGILPKVTLVPVIPRAVHLGTCGTHFSGDCKISDNDIQKIERYNTQILNEQGDVWDKYTIRNGRHLFTGQTKGYGGWAHPRDHEHCLSLVHPNPNFAAEEKL